MMLVLKDLLVILVPKEYEEEEVSLELMELLDKKYVNAFCERVTYCSRN